MTVLWNHCKGCTFHWWYEWYGRPSGKRPRAHRTGATIWKLSVYWGSTSREDIIRSGQMP